MNIKFLWLAFLGFTALTVYRQQASNVQGQISPFTIQEVKVNQINWDQVEIIPDYTLDYLSADFGTSSKITEKVFIINEAGKELYSGVNERVVSIPDAELGNQETITIKYCLTKSKKTSCEETKMKASPKKLSISPEITYPYNNRIFLGRFNLNATLLRQVYGKENEFEPIQSSLKYLKSVLRLVPIGTDVAISVPVEGNSGQFDLSELDNYQNFKQESQKMIYNDDLKFDFEVVADFGVSIVAFPPSLMAKLEAEKAKTEPEAVIEKVTLDVITPEEGLKLCLEEPNAVIPEEVVSKVVILEEIKPEEDLKLCLEEPNVVIPEEIVSKVVILEKIKPEEDLKLCLEEPNVVIPEEIVSKVVILEEIKPEEDLKLCLEESTPVKDIVLEDKTAISAKKAIEAVIPTAIIAVKKVENKILDLHVPFESKYDIFETPPSPAAKRYPQFAAKPKLLKEDFKEEDLEILADAVYSLADKEEKVSPLSLKIESIKAEKIAEPTLPAPVKKSEAPAKSAKECTDYRGLANEFAKRIQMNVIRMVHEDPIISRSSRIRKYDYDKQSDKLMIDLTVKWVDRWMEETYSVDGILTVNKDGKNAKFLLTGKNQNVIDLEEFTAQKTKKAIVLKTL